MKLVQATEIPQKVIIKYCISLEMINENAHENHITMFSITTFQNCHAAVYDIL